MITIGITTYNRLPVIKAMAKSLYESSLPKGCSVRIYDDASKEFSLSELADIFPNAASLHQNGQNVGADLNTLYMYYDFLNSEDEFLLNADSDLLFSRGWFDAAMELFQKTDGILSLFNTPGHPVKRELGMVCEKDTLGAAGTLFAKERIRELCDWMKRQSFFPGEMHVDFEWNAFFRRKGYRLFCTTKSLVQHIGVWGHNSAHGKFDFGTGFEVDSLHNGQALNDTLMWAASWNGIPLWVFRMFPFREIKENAKIILYGAGKIGKEFRRFIHMCRYCVIAAWVDRKPNEQEGVLAPLEMRNRRFDFIVLATDKPKVAISMRDDIEKIDPSLCSKIVLSNFQS